MSILDQLAKMIYDKLEGGTYQPPRRQSDINRQREEEGYQFTPSNFIPRELYNQLHPGIGDRDRFPQEDQEFGFDPNNKYPNANAQYVQDAGGVRGIPNLGMEHEYWRAPYIPERFPEGFDYRQDQPANSPWKRRR